MPKGADKNIPQINRFDWKKVKDWKFPYKGNGLSDPNYIKHKAELFNLNGNGWWWNDGKGLNEKAVTHKQYHARKKKKKENSNEHANRV